jgi:hypothetical protein
MYSRFILSICTALIPACAAAAPVDSSLTNRYLDLTVCMDRTLGKGWQHRYDIRMVTNRWGVEEASDADLDTAPVVVRVTALRCRRELGLARPISPPDQ